ncbi:EI24 domain-containing protein [Pseudoroseomonas ludipueritiae]|uniref:EI24 domain-containing protein n=1 Tax=Pseudoroseomonas ludipueritiae TaxID=198093 RepID=A0ABR7R744_9PROT|nr:EI24 domain-containing protein [Pseudoroseomonas ludipueritiae]MBC9177566.1 EI24 domain-containing protein [Pseudoroseomonas ludipueritiae]
MRAVPASLLLPFQQITDPAFRWPLLKGLGGALLAFLALIGLADWGVASLVGGEGWLATVAGLFGGLLVLISAVWLFVPVALAIAGLFLDEVAAAVEHRHYPSLTPAEGSGLHQQIWAGLKLGLKMLGLTLLIMPLAFFLPPLGAVAFWAVAAVSLGFGLFDGVAQRRMSVEQSHQLRHRMRWSVLAVGAALAALSLVPFANLLVPVLGTAAMTHLLHRRRSAGV